MAQENGFPADRIPIRYTPEGAENLRGLARRYGPIPSDLYRVLVDELRRGFPVDGPCVAVALSSEREWNIRDPAFDDDMMLELQFPDDVDVDLDPPGYRVTGYVEFMFFESDPDYPRARFVCTGIRELRGDFRIDFT